MSDTLVFNYQGECGPIPKLLRAGKYRFEVWGAKGGSISGDYGGKGGYSSGEVFLSKDTEIFVHVGGSGQTTSGGCNSGGKGGALPLSGGGGTDIRIKTDSLYSRIIVAGGGGGSGKESGEIGGYGGGTKGGNGIYGGDQKYPGVGGSQTSGGLTCISLNTDCPPGSFGYGGNTSYSSGGGGGGGGWYGGSASWDHDPGGGGSGFVLMGSSSKPSGYLLGSEYYMLNTQIKGGNEVIPPSPLASNDGSAKITMLFSQKTPNRTPSSSFQIPKCVTPFRRHYSFLTMNMFFIFLFCGSIHNISLPSTTTVK